MLCRRALCEHLNGACRQLKERHRVCSHMREDLRALLDNPLLAELWIPCSSDAPRTSLDRSPIMSTHSALD